jgi:hypothetical protein
MTTLTDVGQAIEKIAKALPECWEILVRIESGTVVIELYDPAGNAVEYSSNCECWMDEIEDAAAHAIEFGAPELEEE